VAPATDNHEPHVPQIADAIQRVPSDDEQVRPKVTRATPARATSL
jgi:hypothetical protein